MNKLIATLVFSIVAISSVQAKTVKENRNDWPTESNACTEAWGDAYRAERLAQYGEGFDNINYDQAWEFVDNCRAGKVPPKSTGK